MQTRSQTKAFAEKSIDEEETVPLCHIERERMKNQPQSVVHRFSEDNYETFRPIITRCKHRMEQINNQPTDDFDSKYSKTLLLHKLFRYIYANNDLILNYHIPTIKILKVSIAKSRALENEIREIVENYNGPPNQRKLDRITEIADYFHWYGVNMSTKLGNLNI
jgi:hypothetical protein